MTSGYAASVTFDYTNYLSKLDSRGGTYGLTQISQAPLTLAVTGATVSQNTTTLKFQPSTSFTISGANITKVTITQTETSRTFTASSVTLTQSSGTAIWTGSANSITFTNNNTDNVNISSISVEYTSAATDNTQFFNFDTWGGTSTQLPLLTSQWNKVNDGYYSYNGTGNNITFSNVDVLKNARLAFNLPSGSYLGIDFSAHHIYVDNGFGIVVKNLKAGDKVTVTATTNSDNVANALITGSNTTEST